MEIAQEKYQKLLLDMQDLIHQAQQNLAHIVTRQKIQTAWQMGKMIDGYLGKGAEGNLFTALENDIAIRKRALYEMHAFFKAYPELPSEQAGLNWSHYKTLAAIGDASDRKYFENFAIENGLTVSGLRQEIKKTVTKTAPQKPVTTLSPASLPYKRGTLFTYKIKTFPHSDKTKIDCGFNIFRDFETNFEEGAVVQSNKQAGDYSFTHYAKESSKLYTYKAYLERVVDGDTLRIILDLGFETTHREIVRLSNINAPESKTSQGALSTKALETMLKDAPFLIIKTNQRDIYGRYIADVFFSETGELGAQKVADEGCYVSQRMVDLGFAQPYSG